MSDLLFAILITFSSSTFLLAIVFYLFIWRPRKKYEISGVLDTVLYRVLLPQEENVPAGESKIKEAKDIMVAMEQLYSAMGAMRITKLQAMRFGRPSVTFEAALPHVGEEVLFFVAVQRIYSQFFSNQLHSYFPSARIDESKDYNLFHPTGASVCAVGILDSSPLLALRTYNELGEDPLSAIVGAFAKLKVEGEGAALQIVIRPSTNTYYERGTYAAKRVRAGETKKDALGGIKRDVLKSLTLEQQPPQQQPGSMMSTKSHDEELAKQLEQKASRPGFDVTLRLVASAKTGRESEEILNGLAAAFSQFDNPQGNSMHFAVLGGRALERELYDFSFRLFSDSHYMYLGASELASMFHFPYAGFGLSNVEYLKSREAPPPTNMPREGLLVGTSNYRGDTRNVYMTDDDRRRHAYIIGQTGTGKSVFIKDMARQDIEAGRGICFIDPHGDAIEQLLAYVPKDRIDDVVYVNPGDVDRPVGLNFLEFDQRYPEQKSLVVNELFGIFEKLFDMSVAGGPMFEQYFRNSTMLVMEDPKSGNTLLEVVRVLADKDFRAYKLSRSSNIVVNTFWQKIAEKAGGESSLQNMVPYITSKFDTFLSNDLMRPIIAQEKSTINFRSMMDEGKIVLINLSKGRLGELNSSLLGLIIVGKILIAALSRVDISDESARRDFFLYIDEFQNVTTNSIATILSEARKYHLDLIIAHQFLGQLDEDIKKAVFGNVGTIFSFRIGSDDGEFMAKQFEPVFNERDLLNIDNYNAYVKLLIQGTTSRAFNMRTNTPKDGNPEMRKFAIEHSRNTYGRPRVEVEAEIRERFKHV